MTLYARPVAVPDRRHAGHQEQDDRRHAGDQRDPEGFGRVLGLVAEKRVQALPNRKGDTERDRDRCYGDPGAGEVRTSMVEGNSPIGIPRFLSI